MNDLEERASALEAENARLRELIHEAIGYVKNSRASFVMEYGQAPKQDAWLARAALQPEKDDAN